MIKLGLTGSIAMGKSTVAAMFAANGVPVHDSDKAVHKAFLPVSPVFSEIARTFPKSWDRKSQTIDRQKLGQIVFSDAEKRTQLENILHPFVWEEQAAFTALHQKMGAPVILFDIPLLYETGADKRLDYVVVVTAPEFIQKQRAMKRPGMTHDKLAGILNSQMPDSEKCALADFIVHTGAGKAFSMREVKSILATLKDRHHA
ncbi:MAG: dephospho-CoA kinase [Micavibrio sp.]|nr:dephospho-CoA kinase [Micavibrio sp.]|tara:strand:- start:397 stop:1002 length:606 start_codon:yes stop_codon:yes gene_type:complete